MNFNELRIRADKDQRSVNVAFLVYREGLGPIFSSVYVNPAECLGGLGAQSQIVLLSSAGEFLKPALRKRWSQFASDINKRVPGGLTRLPSPPHSMRWLRTDSLVLSDRAA